MRKNFRKLVAGAMAGIMMFQAPNIALADSEKVVTLGADLTEEQKQAMLDYFGTSESEVTIIEVNNQEERAYLEGIATEAEIGTHTYSCAYIMPTSTGQINVKTAHLTWVSTSMIANTLVTAGIDSCDVIAAAPRDVSGTGALTGIIKAYEKVTDETLDEEKTNLAMEELYETAQLGQDIGQDQASAVMNEVKQQVLKDDLTEADDVEQVVNEVADYYNVDLNDEQVGKVSSLMANIGKQDYDYDSIKGTMEGLQDKLVDNLGDISESFMENTEGDGGILAAIGDFFMGIFKAIANFFIGLFGGGSEDAKDVSEDGVSEDSILNDTDDSALGIEPTADAGEPANTPATEENTEQTTGETTEQTTDSTANEAGTEQTDSFTVDENNNAVENNSEANKADIDAAVQGSMTSDDEQTSEFSVGN